MGRYIKSFENASAIQAAINTDELLKPYVAYDESAQTIDWNTRENFAKLYFTIEVLSAGTIVWKKEGTYSIDERTISYSKDDGATWSSITSTNEGVVINTQVGDIIRFKGDNVRLARENAGYSYYSSFKTSTALFKVYGNIMSLINSTDFANLNYVNSESFTGLFNSCTGLTSAENLVMPATTLANYCYYSMFSGCTSLTTAPALPATTLTPSCYMIMFDGCSKLNSIKCLATDISASNCVKYWVRSVSSSGTFVKSASMTGWVTGTSGIPTNWTVVEE